MRFRFFGLLDADDMDDAVAKLATHYEGVRNLGDDYGIDAIVQAHIVPVLKPRDDNGNYVESKLEDLAGKVFYVEPGYAGLRRDVIELVREDGAVFWLSAQDVRGDAELVVMTLGENG